MRKGNGCRITLGSSLRCRVDNREQVFAPCRKENQLIVDVATPDAAEIEVLSFVILRDLYWPLLVGEANDD